jgi:Abnormal spindle-like microcephaly-assoc'd, ASPM-SPD-2-Hydin
VFSDNFIEHFSLVKLISVVQRKTSRKIAIIGLQHCALLLLMSSVACNNHISVGQSIAANPSSITFDNTQVNQSASTSVTITNSSLQSYTITAIQASGASFSVVAGSEQQVIKPNATIKVAVAFTPTAAQKYEGTLTVTTSVPNITLALPLSGTGISSSASPSTSTIAASPASLSFGSITTGTTNSLNVSIQNTGSSAISVSGVNASGDGFSVAQPNLPSTIDAGASLQLKVTFSPTNATSYTGSLTIASNASPNPLSIPLSGTGISGSGTSATAHYVNLSWQAPSNTPVPIAGYNIYRSTSAGGPFVLLNDTLDTDTTYVDKSVTAGATYYYQVKSSTAASEESDPSNVAKATIPSP